MTWWVDTTDEPGWGVLEGFEATPRPGPSVRIAPGVAIARGMKFWTDGPHELLLGFPHTAYPRRDLAIVRFVFGETPYPPINGQSAGLVVLTGIAIPQNQPRPALQQTAQIWELPLWAVFVQPATGTRAPQWTDLVDARQWLQAASTPPPEAR